MGCKAVHLRRQWCLIGEIGFKKHDSLLLETGKARKGLEVFYFSVNNKRVQTQETQIIISFNREHPNPKSLLLLSSPICYNHLSASIHYLVASIQWHLSFL
ncbi:hypothetical protein PIB30_024790 [Stylosanthes scabra]|uniref:Uncharacterized protein n=1 Tax=Stylosanthes scabra TaxID=79078 RepID=A0ABU6VCX8_9FABA|nr:hypothetical protein [Stylosanthes scabra]